MIRRLQACLNGDRDRSEHFGVPITPAELALSARACVDAGAEAVHLHPRDAEGAESLLAQDIGAAVAAVRLRCPEVPVGVSTGLWIAGGDADRRAEWVAGWSVLDPVHRPDFASVNLGEAGSPELLTTLAGFAIAPEAGIWSPADAALLKHLPDVRWLRILVEIEDLDPNGPYGPTEEADRILAAIAEVETVRGVEILLHGKQTFAWALVAHAGRLRIPTRMGLEDVVVGPYNEPVRGNAELIRMALRIWESGRVT
jgi:uncharacterized protein (DUF849 family)